MKLIDSEPLTYDTFAMKLETRLTPISLHPLLFRGGAAMNLKKSTLHIGNNGLLESRVPLVTAIYEELHARRVAGSPDTTISNYFYAIKCFFSWGDENGRSLNLASLFEDYIHYTEHLIYRNRTDNSLREESVFAMASTLSSVLDGVLNLEMGMLRQTRIRKPRGVPPWKQSAQNELDREVREMGRSLLNICEVLTLEIISERSAVDIALAPNKNIVVGTGPGRSAIPLLDNGTLDIQTIVKERRTLLNFRIEAEMLIFISQTGMNMDQARSIRTGAFHFAKRKDQSNCLNVARSYKARRAGEVEFEIFSEYKKTFLKYLAFRDQLFHSDTDGPLFQFLSKPGKTIPRYYELDKVKKKLVSVGISYKSPQKLRGIRQNWLLDKTQNFMLVADIGQHTPETLNRNYARPNLNKSLRQVAHFHQIHDPTLTPPGPGACLEQSPKKIQNAPPTSPNPDCRSPSGCLFCVNQRDIDSLDHIWSLISYRHLKSIELSKYRGGYAAGHPSYIVINRISEKTAEFIADSTQRQIWKDEAELRLQERWFHPFWASFIDFSEAII